MKTLLNYDTSYLYTVGTYFGDLEDLQKNL